eukprot:1321788-Amphidinium_carterae.1
MFDGDNDAVCVNPLVVESTLPCLPSADWFPDPFSECHEFGDHRQKDVLPLWSSMVTLNLSPKDPRFQSEEARKALKNEMDGLLSAGVSTLALGGL